VGLGLAWLQEVMAHFKLREGVDVQTYGLGIKEIWEVPAENHKPGCVTARPPDDRKPCVVTCACGRLGC
jgi:hypothetical protein